MTKEEALKLLDAAPCDGGQSKVNPALSRGQIWQIVRTAIWNMPDNKLLSTLFEKRVWQVVKNQKAPRYK
jgi:hypothetical protein